MSVSTGENGVVSCSWLGKFSGGDRISALGKSLSGPWPIGILFQEWGHFLGEGVSQNLRTCYAQNGTRVPVAGIGMDYKLRGYY